MNNSDNNFGLPERTLDELVNYFKENSYVEVVKIYGSRAKGTYKNGSDIDFAVWLKEGGRASDILYDLDELDTPYKFDVTDYKKLTHQGMIDSIDRDGIIFYKK